MLPGYKLLPGALDDVLDLTEYARSYSDEAFENLVDDVYDSFERLAAFPGLGRTRDDLSRGLRSFALNKRRVTVYYLEPSGERDLLLIVRVLRQERNVGEDDFP